MGIEPEHPGTQSGRTVPCVVENCDLVAAIVVRGPKRIELPVCLKHLEALSRGARGPVEIMRELEPPICSHSGCSAVAVAVMENFDGSMRAVCALPLDDLSWVDTPATFSHGRSGTQDSSESQ